MELSNRSDHELLLEARTLIGAERELTAKLVFYLAEIEDRRLHFQAGFGSMFDFCVNALGLSEGEAFRRIVAARLGRRFPIVHSLLIRGAVHLSALALLRDRLTDDNHAELLEAACGKTKREVEAFLATRYPKPDAPTRFRPLSDARFKVEFTASAELREKLERCRDLMSHANPSRDLGSVIERAVDLLLVELQRKRLARITRPRRELSVRKVNEARVTNSTRRKVFERDGLRCTYESPDGRRCDARAFLELDHAEPRALGGLSTDGNLRVRCRAHNQFSAEQVFSRETVERHRHLRQRKLIDDGIFRNGVQPGTRPSGEVTATISSVFEKVRLALTAMGFRDAQARRAVTELERMHDATASPTLEQAFREAILIATQYPNGS